MFQELSVEMLFSNFWEFKPMTKCDNKEKTAIQVVNSKFRSSKVLQKFKFKIHSNLIKLSTYKYRM